MAENKTAFKEFLIQPLKSELKEIDIRKGIVNFEFYEDILSPTITARVTFSSVDILDKGNKIYEDDMPIYGGEGVVFDIEVPDFPNLDFTENGMVVRKISSDKTGRQGLYVLELVSKEVITNETVRVVKRYETPIQSSVESILKLLKTEKEIKTDPTANKYVFIGNTRRPFDVIIWLCPKSVPDDNGTPGFFFYENQDGYRFLSANKLLEGGGGKYDKVFIQREKSELPGDKKNNLKILSSNITKNNDIVMSLRMGMYNNASIFYLMWENKYFPVTFNLKTDKQWGFQGNLKTSAGKNGKDDAPILPDGLEDYTSRYLVRTLDAGALTKAGKLETLPNLPKYQAVAAVRYSLLYSQLLNIIVPLNTELRAGQLIECEIPRPTSEEKKNYESTATGKYVIASLCHKINEAGQGFTSLALIKDSYEFETK